MIGSLEYKEKPGIPPEDLNRALPDHPFEEEKIVFSQVAHLPN